MAIRKRVARVDTLPLLPLRGMVAFPEVMLHLDVGRPGSIAALNESLSHDQTIFLVAQRDAEVEDPARDDLYDHGVVAKVRQVLRLPGDNVRILAEGVYRAHIEEMQVQENVRMARIREDGETRVSDPMEAMALTRELICYFEQYTQYATPTQGASDPTRMMQTMQDVGVLTDYIAFQMKLRPEEQQELLEQTNVHARAEALLRLMDREVAVLKLEQSIHDRVREQMDQNQRDYYLREQMQVIASELGEEDNPLEESEEYRKRIKEMTLPDASRDKLLKECDKLAKMPVGSHEATVVRQYLDTCLELPFGKLAEGEIDITRAREMLDEDHYGLNKVKDRIIEILAVRQLAPDIKGQIVCLAGPPGVGKTSVAKSIARAMGRPYVRVSLGGVRDESDIRGHRKTYIGAMPGRIVEGISRSGTMNPLLVLDEIDKLSGDYRGDPASALLEVLDSEQNHAFRDHFLEVPLDLSQVMFITTANSLDTIPRPLLDRMEVIQLSSYTDEEKIQIAKNHLLPKQMKEHGLKKGVLRIDDEAVRAVIRDYTRESGVRQLERRLAALCRKADIQLLTKAVKRVTVTEKDLPKLLNMQPYPPTVHVDREEIGVVNGLAWTEAGGEILEVEVNVMEGSGKLELTGNLGDVMKESAQAAYSCLRSRAKALGIDPDFYKNRDIHVHFPEGAVPKDGPSAGIAMATAMLSVLTDRKIKAGIAMTGEITLRGRVLPIGGLKEKTMAAKRYGIRTVLIPQDNVRDLEEIDQTVRAALRFVPVETVDQVFDEVFCREAEKKAEAIPAFLPVESGTEAALRQ